MRFNIRILGPVLCLVVLLFGAAAAFSDNGSNSGPGSSNSGPGSGGDVGNPVEGRRIFLRENCYGCHGGRAGGGMCPNLRDNRPDLDDVRQVIRQGTPTGMPPFPELSDVDIANLAAYFRSLRTPAEPTFTHWWEATPSR